LITRDGAQFLVLPGGRILEYFSCGQVASSKVLVALHGAFTTGKSTCDFVSSAAEDLNMHIISPSLPGWGLSSPSSNNDINEFAHDLRLLVDHLKIQEFGLAGTSMGGPFAVSVLAALPERVSWLLLMVPAAFDPHDGAQAYGWPRYFLAVHLMPKMRLWDVMVQYLMAPMIRSMSDPVEGFRNTLPATEIARCDPKTIEVVAVDLQRSVKHSARGASSMLATLSRFNATTKFKTPPPTIIVSGIDDDVVPPNVGLIYEGLLAGSKLIRESGGHLSVGSRFAQFMPMFGG